MIHSKLCVRGCSYYSVSSSFSFPSVLFLTLIQAQTSNALKRALVQIFRLFLVVYFHKKINLLNAVVMRHAFYTISERMWGHALMMIMSMKKILCTDFFEDTVTKFLNSRTHIHFIIINIITRWMSKSFFAVSGELFLSLFSQLSHF